MVCLDTRDSRQMGCLNTRDNRACITKHRSSLPRGSCQAHLHSHEDKPNLRLLLKIERKETALKTEIENDHASFEEKIFRSRRISDLQKYLKSLHKSKVLPQDMYLAIIDDQNQIKIVRKSDNLDKSEIFMVFSNFFKVEGQLSPDQVYEKKENNFVKLSEDEIKEALSNLDANEACGPDDFSRIVLKNLLNLAKSLPLVFKNCINKESFPSQWKVSEVAPICKKNDTADISQYRPICLLSNMSKFFKRVIFQHLYSIAEAQLNKRQFGFHLAVLQLLLSLKEVNKLYDVAKNEHVYGLYVNT